MTIVAKYWGNHADFGSGEREQPACASRIRIRQLGFTLLELLVTISVSAILIAIAVPSYRNIIISNRLTATTNEFVAAINMAKLEAVKRNAAVQLCSGTSSSNGSDDLGTACGTAAGAVYLVETDGSTSLLYQAPSIPSSISLSALTALRYGGQGLARKVGDSAPTYSGLLLDISSSQISTNNHRCVYVTTGSAISTCTYTSTTRGCPAGEDATCQ